MLIHLHQNTARILEMSNKLYYKTICVFFLILFKALNSAWGLPLLDVTPDEIIAKKSLNDQKCDGVHKAKISLPPQETQKDKEVSEVLHTRINKITYNCWNG